MKLGEVYINYSTDQTALEPTIIGATISFRVISATYGDVNGVLRVTPSDLRTLLDKKTTKEELTEKYIEKVLALDKVELNAQDFEKTKQEDANRDARIQAVETQNLEFALMLSQSQGGTI